MGKGKSSDVWNCCIFNLDAERRRFQISLIPTGAGDYTIPSLEGMRKLVLSVLRERLTEIQTDLIFSVFPPVSIFLNKEDEKIRKYIGGKYYNFLVPNEKELSRYFYDEMIKEGVQNLTDWLGQTYEDRFDGLTDAEKQPHLDYQQLMSSSRQIVTNELQKLQQEITRNPLSKIEAFDYGSIYSNVDITFKYIQSITLLEENPVPKFPKRFIFPNNKRYVLEPQFSKTMTFADLITPRDDPSSFRVETNFSCTVCFQDILQTNISTKCVTEDCDVFVHNECLSTPKKLKGKTNTVPSNFECQDCINRKENLYCSTFSVIVCDPNVLIGVVPGVFGTTAYEEPSFLPVWSREEHCYFPRGFRYQVIVLLMMRLPRHMPNRIGMLPKGVFEIVIQHLARYAYSETEVAEWELDWAKKKMITK